MFENAFKSLTIETVERCEIHNERPSASRRALEPKHDDSEHSEQKLEVLGSVAGECKQAPEGGNEET